MNFTSRILEGLMACRGLVEERKRVGCGHPRVGVFFLLKKSRAKRARLCAKVEDTQPPAKWLKQTA
jgi:hypothetical protein